MSVPVTVEEFLDLTFKSGLMDAHRLRAYLQHRGAAGTLPGGPRTLANVLVRDGLLTRFQAEQLLRGKWRNFILAGKYRVLGLLGSGGMGQVYLCEHQVMRRRVAVKVLPSRPEDSVVLERFRREARAVAQLNHPNIVGGHDIDQDGKLHFLVMEYIDGSTFQTIVTKRGPMDPLRAAHYVRQVAFGLQHAHEAGLVHRDIKPSNLLLDRAGTVKILDLGLARLQTSLGEGGDTTDPLTHQGAVMGTPDYMAPEQATDARQADIRADIYSLGATLYFLLAGHGPFRGSASFGRRVCHQAESPRPIRELRPDVPEGLAAVLERMMAREPAERYQTPAEVAADLAPWTRTPIPPPPPQEMPELATPARGPRDAVVARDLPVSLYDPPPLPTPSPGRQGAASPSPGSELPTAPVLDTSGEAVGTPSPAAAAEEASVASLPGCQPPSSPPSREAEGARRPHPAAGKPRRHRALLATAAVLLLGVGAAALAVYAVNADRRPAAAPDVNPNKGQAAGARVWTPLRLLAPAYIYPAGEGLAEWERIIESPAAAATVVIVNPDSGPGNVADPNYARVVERARRNGVTAIGYVSTKYAGRPLPEVKGDVDRWSHFYPGIAGIFFDEQESKADQVLYYAALYEYVRKDRGLSLVVTNPGTECAEEYVARPASDVVCLVEAAKGLSAYRPPAWTGRYPADRFAALLCKTGTPEQMKQVVQEMRANNIGYCFITDAEEHNPWGRLPRYWEAELEAVRQANTR
jgi:serine/threonine protein kinase